MQNVEDLKTLEKLDGGSTQIDSMANQAEQEEREKQDQLSEQSQNEQI